MIFGSKSAQAHFQKEFLWLAEYYPYVTDDACKWEDFKKQFKHGRDDEFPLIDECDWRTFIHRKWNEWAKGLAEKERVKLEPKVFTCPMCGKKKAKEQFRSLLHHTYYRPFGYVTVAVDGALCADCEDLWTAEKKRQSEEHRKELRAAWYEDHKEEIAARQKANRAARNESNRKYAHANRDKINQYVANKRATDPIYKLKCQTRKIVYQSFARKGGIKPERSEQVIGLPIDDFVLYLKSTYKEVYGKEWDGVEKVHIDHIIPLATATTEEEVLRLCHYTNLRLITAEDNQRKGAKLDYAI